MTTGRGLWTSKSWTSSQSVSSKDAPYLQERPIKPLENTIVTFVSECHIQDGGQRSEDDRDRVYEAILQYEETILNACEGIAKCPTLTRC